MSRPLEKPPSDSEQERLANELDRLVRFYMEMPRECQLDALALMETLWRRHRQAAALKRISERQAAPRRQFAVEVPHVNANAPPVPKGHKKGGKGR
jgi:hypothetical protein